MGQDWELSDLRALAAAVHAGSITRGAARVGISQPTLSQKVQRLERSIGQPLLVRGPHGARPTPAGEQLVTYIDRIVALLEEARATLRSASHPSAGRRTLGILEDLAITTLPEALSDFANLHPQVDLDVRVGAAAALQGSAGSAGPDLVLGDPIATADFTVRWRRTSQLVWACLPSVDLAQDPVPLVLFSQPCRWRTPVLETLASHGREFRVAFQSTSVHAVQAAVAAGLGLAALLPRNAPAALRCNHPRTDLPIPPRVEVAISRRTGTAGDSALDSLERLLRHSVR